MCMKNYLKSPAGLCVLTTLAALSAFPSFALAKHKPSPAQTNPDQTPPAQQNPAPQPVDPCADVPAPTDVLPTQAISQNAGFGLHLAECTYRRGRAPTFDELNGNWLNVGIVNTPDFRGVTNLQDVYDPAGNKNQDGSSTAALTFTIASSTDFNGKAAVSGAVAIQDMGNKDSSQGPNAVTLNSDENAACFAQYAYDETGSLVQDEGHYNYECRIVSPTTAAKMICRINEIQSDETTGTVALYFAYIKKGN